MLTTSEQIEALRFKPMETAPRDGSWIIVQMPDTTTQRVHWAQGFQDEYQPYVPPGWYYETPSSFFPLQVVPTGWREAC